MKKLTEYMDYDKFIIALQSTPTSKWEEITECTPFWVKYELQGATERLVQKRYMFPLQAWCLAYYHVVQGGDITIPDGTPLHESTIILLNAMYGQRDWAGGIKNNTYTTHRYGEVPSYSGNTKYVCGVTIKGESSSGSPAILHKEGGLYIYTDK